VYVAYGDSQVPCRQWLTRRDHGFDANSNRTSLATNTSSGACPDPTAGTTTTSAYDAADRQIDTGFAYDEFGRTTTAPASRAGGQSLTSTYFANDLVRTQEQGGTLNQYELDPAMRPWKRTTTTPSGVKAETNHYSGGGDSPIWSSSGDDWTRYAGGIGGDLSAIQMSSGSISLQLTDLQGSVIAEASTDSAATGLSNLSPTDEFGVPTQPDSRRYAWLGGKQRSRELPLGVIQMGVRSYVPQLGRFLQVDPLSGGSANDYDYANADPINQVDLNGQEAIPGIPRTCQGDWGKITRKIRRKNGDRDLVIGFAPALRCTQPTAMALSAAVYRVRSKETYKLADQEVNGRNWGVQQASRVPGLAVSPSVQPRLYALRFTISLYSEDGKWTLGPNLGGTAPTTCKGLGGPLVTCSYWRYFAAPLP
jgi:RHS repeat-associated protein